jgi:predicted MarR family transcription regulator
MEHDVGLGGLSKTEKDVFLAAHSLSTRKGNVVESIQIRSHDLVEPMAQATYHRALRALLKMGLLERAGDSKAKTYVVRSDLVSK